jgi:hypothetical protein
MFGPRLRGAAGTVTATPRAVRTRAGSGPARAGPGSVSSAGQTARRESASRRSGRWPGVADRPRSARLRADRPGRLRRQPALRPTRPSRRLPRTTGVPGSERHHRVIRDVRKGRRAVAQIGLDAASLSIPTSAARDRGADYRPPLASPLLAGHGSSWSPPGPARFSPIVLSYGRAGPQGRTAPRWRSSNVRCLCDRLDDAQRRRPRQPLIGLTGTLARWSTRGGSHRRKSVRAHRRDAGAAQRRPRSAGQHTTNGTDALCLDDFSSTCPAWRATATADGSTGHASPRRQ